MGTLSNGHEAFAARDPDKPRNQRRATSYLGWTVDTDLTTNYKTPPQLAPTREIPSSEFRRSAYSSLAIGWTHGPLIDAP